MRASRLGHKKSRFGCLRCKQRRVKCDEQRPCQNCVRHDAHCSLLNSRPCSNKTVRDQDQDAVPGLGIGSSCLNSLSDADTVDSVKAPSEQSSVASARFDAGRTSATVCSLRNLIAEIQSKVQTLEDELSMSGHVLARDDQAGHDKMSDERQISAADWMQSLQLLHHYCTSTYATLANTPESQHVWQLTVPQIAFGHEFFMNGLLAVSALHFAYLKPELSKSYSTISTHYQNLALDAFSSRVTDIDESNSDAYYLLAGFIFLMSMFAIARSGGKEIAPNEVAQSFVLVQGIKNIRSVQHAGSWVAHGPLAAALLPPEATIVQPLDPQLEFVVRLNRLSATIAGAPLLGPDADEVRSSCLHAVDLLRHTHASVVQSTSGARRVWAWPFQLPRSFPNLISKGNPLALVTLAYFASLVREFEDESWFSRGWSSSVQTVVEASLDQPWKAWVVWPSQSGPEDLGLKV